MRSWITLFVAGSLSYLPLSAQADRVHLTSGTVIEGKARREGEKVIVELESGSVTLSAGQVQRIENAETVMQRVDERERALAKDDVTGLLKLADYCRDHDMRAREQTLLRKVLEVAPDQPEARARLGYVRTEVGWVTRDEQARAAGLVKYEGRWLTQEQVLALKKLEAETKSAQLQRERAQLEVEAQRSENKRAELAQAERDRQNVAQNTPSGSGIYSPYNGYYGYSAGFALPWSGRVGYRPNPHPLPGPQPPVGGGPPVPVNGYKNPQDMGWNVPGYRNPFSYF
jgi:hypothetical protein